MIKYMISAARLGLYTHGNCCLSGKEVEHMGDDELSRVIDKVTVFYRTTPKNKNKIIRVSTDDITQMIYVEQYVSLYKNNVF